MNEYDDLLNDSNGNEYDKLAPTIENQQSDLKSSFYVAKDFQPDEHAKKVQLADELNLPVEFVNRNYEKLSKKAEIKKIESEYDSIIESNPRLTAWLKDPNNAAISKDDLSSLKSIESLAKDPSYFSNLYDSVVKGAAQLGKGLSQLPATFAASQTAIAPTDIDNPFELKLEPVKAPDELLNNEFTKYFESVIEKRTPKDKDYGKAVIESVASGDISGAAKSLSYQVAESIPQLALVMVNPREGIKLLMGSSAGSKFAENLKDNVPSDTAALNALITGGVEGAIESIGGIGAGAFKNTVKQIVEKSGEETAKTILKSSFKNFLKNSGEEGLEEVVTSLAQDSIDYAMDVNPDALNGMVLRSLNAGIAGAAAGGLMVGSVSIPSTIVDITKAKSESADAKATYENLGSVVNNSKLAERSPERFKKYLDDSLANTKIENIYLSPESLETYFQKKGVDPIVGVNDLGLISEYNQAKKNGNDIEIKTSDWITKTKGKEYFQDLADDIKFNPESMSVNDINKEQVNEDELRAEILAEADAKPLTFEDKISKIGNDIQSQLMSVGFKQNEARAQSKLYEAFFRTQSENSGVAPDELFSKYNLKISRSAAPAAIVDESVLNQIQKKTGLFFVPKQLQDGSIQIGDPEDGTSINAKYDDITKSYIVNSAIIKNVKNANDIFAMLENVAENKNAEKLIVPPEALKDVGFEVSIGMLKDAGFSFEKQNGKTVMSLKIDNKLNQDVKGQIRFGKDKQFKIELFESADKSTFLHESAHFFLEVMGDVSDSSGAVKDDYNAVLNFLGIESRDQIKVEHHEKFARTFEAYLMNGKAPTSELRRAFNTFKIWLTNIYKDFLGLSQAAGEEIKLSPEITDIMDRMLATQEEIDQALGKMGGEVMFGDPRLAGMSEADTLEYLSAAEFARMEAVEILDKRLYDEVLRKQDTAYKNAYKKIYDEEMASAESKPEFKVIAAIQSEFKLSKPVIDKSYSIFKGYLPNKSTQVENGFHPDFVASMFGYENGQAMLQAIAPYRRGIDDYVRSQVATEMKIKYPELLESPELSDEAIKLAHNEKRSTLKRLELETLAKNDPKVLKNVASALIKRVPKSQAVKAQAVNIISTKKVSELKPYIYLSAERKYAREASRAYYKGDFDAAFEAKRKEYLNFELYRAAQDAKDNVKKQVKNFKRLFKSDEDLAKSRDIDLVNAARAILAEYGITKSDKTADEYLEKLRQYDPEKYTIVSQHVKLAIDNSANYNSVTYEQFEIMSESVNALWDLSKSEKEILIEGQLIDADKIKESLANRLSEISSSKELAGYNKKVQTWDKVKMGLLGMKSSLRRVESWADAVGGDFKKFIFNPISEGATNYRSEKKRVILKYLDIVKTIEKGLTKENIPAPEINYTFSGKAELLGALLHTGNDSNFEKLIKGRNWGKINEDGSADVSSFYKMIDRFHSDGTLTKADYDYLQATWNLLEELKPDAQKAHKKMYGFYFNEITAKEFSTPFGTYKGGYVPAVADQFMAQDAAIRMEKEMVENMGNSFMYPTTGRGFTKSRVQNYHAPLSIDLSLVPAHIDKVLRFVHIEPRVKDVARIVMDNGFRKTLDAFDPTVGGDMLVPWLQRSAQQKTEIATQGWGGKAIDKVFRELRSRTSLQIMSLNVLNSMQQITGLSIAGLKVQPKYLRNSLWRYVKAPKVLSQEVASKSSYMANRNTTSVIEVMGEIDDLLLNPSKYEIVRDYLKKNSQILSQITQSIVDNITWAGAYDQAVENGASEAQAVRDADSAVRLTQGSFNAEDISRFETGTPFVRAFTMFYSYFNMQANILGTEFTKVFRDLGMRKGAGRAMYIYTLGLMIPAVLAELIMRAGSGDLPDADDDDEYLTDYMALFFGSQFRTVTAMVPLVGQTANTAVNYFNDKKYDDRISGSAAITTLESSVRAPYSVYKAISENGSNKMAVKDTLTLIGMTLGVPAGAAARPIGYLLDVEEGKANPENAIDFTRGLVTGKTPRN